MKQKAQSVSSAPPGASTTARRGRDSVSRAAAAVEAPLSERCPILTAVADPDVADLAPVVVELVEVRIAELRAELVELDARIAVLRGERLALVGRIARLERRRSGQLDLFHE